MRPGLRVGKYVLGERIARGGMAEVWAGRVEGPEGFVKPVALKFILETFKGDTDFERLFVNEARVAAQLQHANLVTIFDFDKVPPDTAAGELGRYYIAMERVDGCDLRRLVQATAESGYGFAPALALHAAGEVLKGLRYVHERHDPETGLPLGLVHRDVSPHNVLVGLGGEVKLSDFGIAKAMTQSLGTQSGTIRGKLSYASPEQLRAEMVDHRTDQFALGVTLWEMLAQRRLFDGADEVEIIGKVLRCEIPPLGPFAPLPVSPAAEAVVRRMLAPARDERFPTTASALSAVLSLPEYTHDGAPLSDLMRALFGGPRIADAATVKLEAPTPFPAPHAFAPPAFAPHASPGLVRTPAPALRTPFPRSSSPGMAAQNTRTVTGPELSAAGQGSWRTPPPQAATPGPGRRRGHASGYVSVIEPDGAGFDDHPPPGRRAVLRGRRSSSAPLIAGALGFLGIAVVAFIFVSNNAGLSRGKTKTTVPGARPSRSNEGALGNPTDQGAENSGLPTVQPTEAALDVAAHEATTGGASAGDSRAERALDERPFKANRPKHLGSATKVSAQTREEVARAAAAERAANAVANANPNNAGVTVAQPAELAKNADNGTLAREAASANQPPTGPNRSPIIRDNVGRNQSTTTHADGAGGSAGRNAMVNERAPIMQ